MHLRTMLSLLVLFIVYPSTPADEEIARTPEPRFRHGFATLSTPDGTALVAIGGQNAGVLTEGFLPATTYIYGPEGTWRALETEPHPPASMYPLMAEDTERDTIVLFGGFDGSALTAINAASAFLTSAGCVLRHSG